MPHKSQSSQPDQSPERKAYKAQWYLANKERTKAQRQAWYEANKETVKANARAWGAANPEKLNASKAKYRAANQDKLKPQEAEYRRLNKEKCKAAIKRWCAANPEAVSAIDHRRRARKMAADGSHSAAEVSALFKTQRGRCVYCRTSLSGGYHKDHVIPLLLGGSNWITNIQLLCQPCNQRKAAKHPVDFAQSLGLLV